MKRLATLMLFVVSICAYSQQKNVNIIPTPIVYYLPETRWALGVAATATYRFAKDDTAIAKPSQTSVSLSYTQNKQILAYSAFQIFLKNNRYYTYGEIGYFKYNYHFFGIGNQMVNDELFGVNYPRIKLNFLERIHTNTYVGLRYQFEDYHITETADGGVLEQNLIYGTPSSRTSGVGLGVFYDSRDMVFFPTKGVTADLTFFNNSQLWGGNVRFDRAIADLTAYKRLNKHLVWANNLYASKIWGNAPFNMLSEMGGPKKLRGYFQGRFRDKNVVLAQTEARFDVYKRLGGVAFYSAGAMGNKETESLRLGDIKTSYGLGLRYTFNKKDHINLRFDYAFGKDASNFYLTLGEAF